MNAGLRAVDIGLRCTYAVVQPTNLVRRDGEGERALESGEKLGVFVFSISDVLKFVGPLKTQP